MINIFKLKTGDGSKRPTGLASQEEIDRNLLIGYSHIVYEGNSHFLYIEDESERFAFKRKIGLPEYEWFQEGTGNKNWVLYNPLQYKPDKNWNGKKILKFNKDEYKGGRFETPINASSCCGMFSWITLPESFNLDKLFYTKEIVDMNLMFAGAVLPDNFDLGKHFHTDKVKDMRYMFYECTIPEGFNFNDKFVTSNVRKMDYMFSECIIPKGVSLPACFDTSKVVSMDHMFYESEFAKDFDFGPSFKIWNEVNTDMMFADCKIAGETIDNDHCEDFEYMRKLLSRQTS